MNLKGVKLRILRVNRIPISVLIKGRLIFIEAEVNAISVYVETLTGRLGT